MAAEVAEAHRRPPRDGPRLTLSLDASAPELEEYVLQKHHERKHGKDAYYGQK